MIIVKSSRNLIIFITLILTILLIVVSLYSRWREFSEFGKYSQPFHPYELRGGADRTFYVCQNNSIDGNTTDSKVVKIPSDDKTMDGENEQDSEYNDDTQRGLDGLCQVMPDINYYGHTFKTLPLGSTEDCCQTCSVIPDCQSWTFDSNRGLCNLKSQLPQHVVPCPGYISGVVKKC